MTRDKALWLGLLTGPVVWFISLEAKFAVAPWVCAFGWKPAEILISLAALLTTVLAGWLAWSQWRQLVREPATPDRAKTSRPRAMAIAGILLSVSFCLVLVAQTLPEIILAGCE